MSWNKSTKIDLPVVKRRQMENFIKDRSRPFNYNYRAEELTCFYSSHKENEMAKSLKRTQEMPNSCKLATAKPWNPETSFEHKLMDKVNLEKTIQAIDWCKKKHGNIDSYIDPVASSALCAQKNRKLLIGEPSESPTSYKLNRYAIEKRRTRTTTRHSGVWEYNSAAGRYMWSDTGSFVHSSPGDIVLRHDPDAYNYVALDFRETVHTVPSLNRTVLASECNKLKL